MPQPNSISLKQAVEEEPLAVAPETPLLEVIKLMSRDWDNSCVLGAKSQQIFNSSLAYADGRHKHRYGLGHISSGENLQGQPLANRVAFVSRAGSRPHCSCVLAVANSQLEGILTEQALVELISSGKNIGNITLAEVMSRNVITFTSKGAQDDLQDIFAAFNLFRQYQIRHLPIIDEGNHVLGVVTQNSLRQVLRSADVLKLRTVSEVMSRAIHALTTNSVLSVAQLMSDYGVSEIPIVETAEADNILYPKGIITERDIVQFQLLELNLAQTKAEEVMSTPLYLTKPEDSLWQVSQLMNRHLLRRLVVTGEQEELLGVVSQDSLLRAINLKDLQGYFEIWQAQMLQWEQTQTKSLQNRNSRLAYQLSQQAQELQQQRYREQLVGKIALKIRQALDLASVLQTTVEEVRKLMQADRVLIYRFEPDGRGIVTTEAVSEQQWSILNQVVKDNCFEDGWIKPYQQGYVHALADIEQGNLSPCHREFLRSFQIKANLVSPILISQDAAKDKLWGLLIVHQCSDTRNWQESELELLQRLTTQVAIAVGQAELYQQAQIELEQRRQAEIALRESESRFRTMANTAPVMIWMSDTNKLCTYFNQPWLDFTGRTLEQELGNGWTEVVHPEDRATCWEIYSSAFDARQKFTMEYRLKNAQDEYRWMLDQGVPRFDESGEFMGYIGSCVDISDRILAEQTLGERETQLRTALDAAALGTWIWDITTNKVVLSKRAQLILGYEPQVSYSLDDMLELIQPEDRSEIYAKATKAIAAAELYEIETCIALPDHQERWIVARGHVLLDPQGQPTRMMGVVADISEKKRLAEKSLRHQRLESLGSLAGGVAHDLNNILTPILMSVQLLPVTLPQIDPRSREIIKMLESNVKRGSALVQQVLSFARGIEGKRGIVQIKHLIRDIYQIARETFPKTIKIQTDVTSNLWAVCGDATQIHQVLLNLAINARDAMSDGGSLDVSAANLVLDEAYVRSHPQAKVGSYVAISIVDTGVGIPPQDLEQIFEPFFTTKGTKGGTGLGLATVINIVESHGGFINVVSEVDQGTQFNIMIPAAESTATDHSEILSIPKGNNELILVVDDEATIREITKASLETHNYRVITANDGIEAIASYVQHQAEVKLVLMNMLMPAMDGATAIKTLQKINSQVKIIALSGRNFSNQTFSDRNLNIQSFLAKPYTTQALLQAIKNVLNN